MMKIAYLSLFFFAFGCVKPGVMRAPKPARKRINWPVVAAVKVPARTGLTVSVKAADLIRVKPELRGAAGLSVRYYGRPVPFRVEGGGDGRLDGGDRVLFTVTHRNRHSPYLVYTIEKGATLPGSVARSSKPTRGRFAARPFVQLAPAERTSESKPRVDAWAKAMGLKPDTDYLMLAPRAVLPALEPLVSHRRGHGRRPARIALEDLYALNSGGNPDPKGLSEGIGVVSEYTGGRLRFLFLVGDSESRYRPDSKAPTPLPAFYLRKIHYGPPPHSPGYPSDSPYASRRPMAIGRLPARTAAQVRGYVRKVIGYETREPAGTWQRKLAVLAGPAGYGAMVDKLIETLAQRFFEHQVPYDYDLRLIFAKPGSPYAYRFDLTGPRFVKELNAGALVAAYVGHERATGFDAVWFRGRSYLIARRADIKKIRIPAGKPFFLLISCSHGSFDSPGGYASVAELLVLNPEGPVAVFAAGRPSHPYPNYLYGLAFANQFLKKHPSTVGQGVNAMKRDMSRRSIPFVGMLLGTNTAVLKNEHMTLYNLFGDPAVRLRYPERLAVSVLSGPGRAAVLPGTPVTIAARTTVRSGRALVTIQAKRSRMVHPLSPVTRSMSLAETFAVMARNYEKAITKVVRQKHCPAAHGVVRCTLKAPPSPGTYIAKVFVTSGLKAAAGHTSFLVGQ